MLKGLIKGEGAVCKSDITSENEDVPHANGGSSREKENCDLEYALITDGNGSVVRAVDSDGKDACKVTYGAFGNLEDLTVNESNSLISEELKTSDIICICRWIKIFYWCGCKWIWRFCV